MNEDIFYLGVKALIRNQKGQILLLKVDPKSLKGNTESHWDIPGGRTEKGSTVQQTLARELKEETGLELKNNIEPLAMVLSNIRIPVDNSDVGLILGVYICNLEEPISKIRLSAEHLDYGWFEPAVAAELLAFKYPKEFTDKIKVL